MCSTSPVKKPVNGTWSRLLESRGWYKEKGSNSEGMRWKHRSMPEVETLLDRAVYLELTHELIYLGHINDFARDAERAASSGR